ncbi:hypothetical protein ACJ72_04833 [Emergomyces africanus]|uniref:Uncharacterized protein n=1 Tax=Emergomyces africanus TaxID=1955775 RepID=A0A1B7NVM7_9EURO|nr:hypothetical protein ACJ72_04833 [Emergomyces africanus]
MKGQMDQMLHDRKDQYPLAQILIAKLIKERKPIGADIEEFLAAMKACDRISQTYHQILDCPTCYFQAEDSIIKNNFTVITDVEPVFFSQMPLADLREYTFEPLQTKNRFYEYGDEEFLSVADNEIVNILRTASKETPEFLTLGRSRKWHNEIALRNVRWPFELVPSRSPERYEWQTTFIWGLKSLPHTVILSFQATRSPAPIMRGELLSILSVTWWKNKLIFGTVHKFIPILLISIRTGSFRTCEAFYTGSKFVLRYSKPVPMNFTEPIEDRVKAFDWVIQWLLSTPLGDTQNLESAISMGRRVSSRPR